LPDVHDKATRSRNMAAIRNKNTKPEMLLRSALHRAGIRFRTTSPLPGKPDLTLRKYKATIFVHGCFWHRHDCPYFKQPVNNAAFWREKLARNVARDKKVTDALRAMGWRQLIVWECAIRGKGRLPLQELVQRICDWLASDDATGEISGNFE
jgi:DNA mismatch endonuclease (patch repair protein)